MKVNVDVYTTDVDAGIAAFRKALESGATDVQLRSNEDWESKQFESLNLMFEADHKSEALNELDDGPFTKDRP
jgi:hypothetical protein